MKGTSRSNHVALAGTAFLASRADGTLSDPPATRPLATRMIPHSFNTPVNSGITCFIFNHAKNNAEILSLYRVKTGVITSLNKADSTALELPVGALSDREKSTFENLTSQHVHIRWNSP